jgi:hypothetical protein
LNGMAVESGESIDLYTLSLGAHTLTVNAMDNAGNPATEAVEFNIIATIDSLQDLVDIFYESGHFYSPKGIRTSLLAKLYAAEALIEAGEIDDAKDVLGAFINQLEAQSGAHGTHGSDGAKGVHVSAYAANILITGAQYLIDNL